MIGRRGKFWQQLEQIRNPTCRLCPLHKTDGNVCVMGRGTAYAPIMLIGEAPGEAEARTGQPFMGAAGGVLDEILTANDMKHLVYITNINKCRPPENRKPKEEERDICAANYLDKELDLLKPKVIVLLGKTPIEHCLGDRSFTRGKIEGWGKWIVMPTWHPAYFLHSGSKVILSELREHLYKAKDLALQ